MLTRAQFQEWLDGFADADVVGQARSFCCCPLANAIQQKKVSPIHQVCVDQDHIMITEPQGRYCLPREPSVIVPLEPWQDELVYEVDESTPIEEEQPITAGAVRVIFAAIPDDEALAREWAEAEAQT